MPTKAAKAARDPEALARGLLEALERPEERRRWAEAALVSVRDFDVGRMVERTLAQYEAVLRERDGRARSRGPAEA